MPWQAIALTLFPEMFPGPLGVSLIGRALQDGLWRLSTRNIRDFACDKHRSVDDSPAGGGAGMVMRADVAAAAIDAAISNPPNLPRIYLSPRGKPCFAGALKASTSASSRRANSKKSLSAIMCFRVARLPRWP